MIKIMIKHDKTVRFVNSTIMYFSSWMTGGRQLQVGPFQYSGDIVTSAAVTTLLNTSYICWTESIPHILYLLNRLTSYNSAAQSYYSVPHFSPFQLLSLYFLFHRYKAAITIISWEKFLYIIMVQWTILNQLLL